MHSIISERLVIRTLGEADVTDDYVAWLRDAEVNRFLETRHVEHSRDSVAAFVTEVSGRPNELLFGIFLRDGHRHIGNIKVGPIHPIHGMADVSLLLGARDSWGRGYATEAIGAVCRYAFDELAIRKLGASMYAANLASKTAFLKAGFREEGLRRDHYDLDGERSDIVELGLIPSDVG